MKKNHRLVFKLILLLSLLSSCLFYQGPSSSLGDMQFDIFPHIVNKKGEYYLIYKVDVSKDKRITIARPVYSKIHDGKAYYYFGKALRLTESGELKERPLELDGFTEYAGKDEVYWLNKDSTEVKLMVVWEK